jgi:hypothetical protein
VDGWACSLLTCLSREKRERGKERREMGGERERVRMCVLVCVCVCDRVEQMCMNRTA